MASPAARPPRASRKVNLLAGSARAHNRRMLRGTSLACVRGERPLFRGVDLQVAAGEWLHVRGANGAGKTSLLRLLAGLAQPAEGEIRWQDEPIAEAGAAYRRE